MHKPLARLSCFMATALTTALLTVILLTTTLLTVPKVAAQADINPSSPQTIAEVQTLLSDIGLDPGAADGIMGKRTAAAISDYQNWAGLPVTGRIDEELVLSLRTNTAGSGLLTQEQLIDLVAPIALYPDDLLAIVLPASTFPLEIVQAARFLEKRKTDTSLKPSASWDASVLGLLNYPEAVARMSDDLEWTEKLGTAVVNQQNDVMDAVQAFRLQAYGAGNLSSNEQQTVSQETVESDSGAQREVVVIQSANPEVIYVPQYDPSVVVVSGYTGPPPIYYSPPYPYYYSPAATFFTGMFVGAAIGYAFNWGRYDISYNRNVNINVNRPGNWRPSNRPGNSWRPSNRPGYRPGYRPGRPPGARPPNRPGNRPGTLPSRPNRPGVSPGRPAQRPATRPAQRPSQRPATRPAQRPATRPAQRPSRTATGNFQQGRHARLDSNRGAQSRQRPKATPRPAPSQRPSATQRSSRPAARPAQRSHRNAFSRSGGRAQTRSHSNRGAASRGGGRRR